MSFTTTTIKAKLTVVSQPPTIQNVPIALKNTNTSITLPAGTKQFFVSARSGLAFRVAYISGDADPSTGTFITTNFYSSPIVSNGGSGFTLYVETNKDDDVIEVESWA